MRRSSRLVKKSLENVETQVTESKSLPVKASEVGSGTKKDALPLLDQIKKTSRNSKKIITTLPKNDATLTCSSQKTEAEEEPTNDQCDFAVTRSSCKKECNAKELPTPEENVLSMNVRRRILTPAKNSKKQCGKMQMSVLEEEVIHTNLENDCLSNSQESHDTEEECTEDKDILKEILKDQEVDIDLTVMPPNDDQTVKQKQKRKSVVDKNKTQNEILSTTEDVGSVDLQGSEEITKRNDNKLSCMPIKEKLQFSEDDTDPPDPGRPVEEIDVPDDKKKDSGKDSVVNDGPECSPPVVTQSYVGPMCNTPVSQSDTASELQEDDADFSSLKQDRDVTHSSMEQGGAALDEKIEAVPLLVNVIENPAPMKTITCQKAFKHISVNIDRSKYESSYFNKFKGNTKMQSMCDLKNNSLFQDHMKMKRSQVKEKGDVMNLDKVTLVKNTPSLNNVSALSSCIQTTVPRKLYIDTSTAKSNQINTNKDVEKLMKRSVLTDDLESMERAPKMFKSKNSVKLESKKKNDETAGKGWYNLPKTEITDKIKNDLQLIKMRNVLDSKHHYKRNDTNKLPKYFQMGTIVEGSHEFYSARVPKKKRKSTMVDELLNDAEFRRKNKKKYIEIRKKQMDGGKGFYKKLKNKGKKAWEKT